MPVHRNVFYVFDSQIGFVAEIMRKRGWNSFDACIYMITDAANHGEESGQTARVREEVPALYTSMRSLYQFAVLATSNRLRDPDAFCLPTVRKPFSD
jgi:hypothetical protein